MVPIATEDLKEAFPTEYSGVYPSVNADIKLRKLWSKHGDPQSSKYSNPELNSLSALVTYNARTHTDEIAYLYPHKDTFQSVTWRQFDVFTTLAAAYYAEVFRTGIEVGIRESSQPTIALLGTGNTFQYWITQIALCRIGVRVLLLSDKNADVARDHLLDVCNAIGIVVEPKYLESVQALNIPVFQLHKVDLLQTSASFVDYLQYTSDDVWNQHTMIIHSSGSTGLPKPIIHTNRSMMLIARMYRLFQSFIIENWYLCFPMFHIAGVSIILGGLPSALPTTLPPENWPPSPGAILTAWKKLEELGYPVDCLHCAPSVIEDLCEYLSLNSKPDYSPLLNLKALQPGGAALSPSLLKKLTNVGVNVKTTYGSTEIGPPFRTIPDTSSNPNCYHVKSLFPDNELVQMEPQGEGLYECVVYKGFELAAELWELPDAPNPYRTNDLFLEDPPGSGLFVLQGRKDDIIVHSNGEKTNALPLQMAIEESHPGISKVVVFGTDQPCTSAIVQCTCDEKTVFQVVAKVCESFPAFSRLDESMIMVLPEGETLPVTPKGNVRRKEAWKIYGDDIEKLYTNLLAGGSQSQEMDISTHMSDLDFVRLCLAKVTGSTSGNISDDASFYGLGLQSQTAVRLRSLLTQRFGKFPLMYIFEYPSVLALSEKLGRPEQPNRERSRGRNFAYIQDVISRYTNEIKSWRRDGLTTANTENGEIIYLTGATGALGNALLAEFASNRRVSKVYCAIRGANARQRLTDQLKSRGYGSEVYDNDKFVTTPYDMTNPQLGLDEAAFAKLSSEVSTVMHNAWKLDFNQQVNMFEPDCLSGTLNLMRFCQTNIGKTFTFTSSVATNLGEAAINQSIEEVPIANNPSLALETGYAQSKFIVEIVSQAYAEHTNSPVRICRVGQLCGHTTLGAWNSSEMFPIMIATGLEHLNAMPVFPHQTVNWLPVDVCANAISTLLSTPASQSYGVHNLVNPSTISWIEFMGSLQKASDVTFERVSMQEWVSRLHKLCEEKDGVPGAKLLGFFESMGGEGGEARFETEETQKVVKRLRECAAVSEELLGLYLGKWRQEGFLK